MEKDPLEHAAVKLPKDLLREVDRLAAQEDRTRSAMIRRFVREGLQRYHEVHEGDRT